MLERLPRGARLTPGGRAFLPEARSALLGSAAGEPRGAKRHSPSSSPRSEIADRPLARGGPAAAGDPAHVRGPSGHVGAAPRVPPPRCPRGRARDGVAYVAIGPEPGPGRLGPSVFLGYESFVVIIGLEAPCVRLAHLIRLDSLADDGWILFPVMMVARHRRHDLRSRRIRAARRPPGPHRSRRPHGSRRPASAWAICCLNIVPLRHPRTRAMIRPTFRKLAAYTRAEFSQADALIAALGQGELGSIRRPARSCSRCKS